MVSLVSKVVLRERHSQVDYHVNIAFSAVGPGLTGKRNDFLPRPFFIPCQSGQGVGLKAGIKPSLEPGADFLLYEKGQYQISILLLLLKTRGD